MKEILANIASIQSGYHFKEKIENDKDGAIRFIQLKDIDESNSINYSQLIKNNLLNIQNSKFLNKGDVIIKCRGMNFTASVIDRQVENIVATSHFFVIRIKTKNVLPEYLSWFLNDAPTQKIIKLGISGTHMQMLNKKFLEKIEITFPSIDIQRNIINLEKLKEHERKLLTRKVELKKLLIELQLRKLLIKCK